MTTEKTIHVTLWTFVGKVMFLLFNMLSRFVLANLPRSKSLLISWLKSHPHMTTQKSIALTRWNIVGKVKSLLFNKLSR